MNITQEVNMTFIHNLTIHFYSKTLCYIWVLDSTNVPLKIKKLDNFNQFRKEVKSMLLNNSFYTLEEFLQAKLV